MAICGAVTRAAPVPGMKTARNGAAKLQIAFKKAPRKEKVRQIAVWESGRDRSIGGTFQASE
jgi:hypothetical protein